MKKIVSIFLIICLLATTAFATDLDTASAKTGAYMLETVTDPQVGSVGGEWAVLGLARSGYTVPQSYWDTYYQTVVDYVKDCDGNLHDKKYTEYSRLIVALTSIGADPINVGGYNLLTALGDYDKTIWQGMNGPIWALIALDSGNYDMPQNPEAETQATRQMYIDRILDCQLSDGGWSLFGGTASASGNETSDPDITGMALQALANYQSQSAVATATKEALACMSQMQSSDGGFASWGTTNVESAVQILVALDALGMSIDAPAFVKDATLVDNILSYQQENGSFLHTANGSGDNQMSTEQGYYGLVAAQRALAGKPSLYHMTDVSITVSGVEKPTVGLPGMDSDIQKMPITTTVSFPDTTSEAVLDLASRAIINGNPDGNFYPENTMTRAEFATIVVKALGFTPKAVTQFSDVSTEWFATYVGTAYTKGIVNGTTATTFDPEGTITRQDAAVMVARAAKLCGMDTDYDTQAVRDTLSMFMDYVKVAEYAQSSMAFCYDEAILDDSAMNINPLEPITRGEIAQMLYNLLGSANLK